MYYKFFFIAVSYSSNGYSIHPPTQSHPGVLKQAMIIIESFASKVNVESLA